MLGGLEGGAILDEIQRAPELVSSIQEVVDESLRNSVVVLTGSQQCRCLRRSASRSPEERGTGILRLLPFYVGEAAQLRPDMDTDGTRLPGRCGGRRR